MARPHGFDHFSSYLSGLDEHYVIIGGGAASILMTDEGLEFRATNLLDDEYFDLTGRNIKISQPGIPVINTLVNICLKARAHRELSKRK